MMHLFAHSAVIDRAVLMAQREVAERIVAPPGSRTYGCSRRLRRCTPRWNTCSLCRPRLLLRLQRFTPRLFGLTMHPRFEELAVEAEGFLRFLRQIFALKRKTLANNLRASGYERSCGGGGLQQLCVWMPRFGQRPFRSKQWLVCFALWNRGLRGKNQTQSRRRQGARPGPFSWDEYPQESWQMRLRLVALTPMTHAALRR